MGLHLLPTVVFTVVKIRIARITSRLLALLAIHFTVKLLELLELVVLAQHPAVSAKAYARPWRRPWSKYEPVNDEHRVVDEYVSYDEPLGAFDLFHSTLSYR